MAAASLPSAQATPVVYGFLFPMEGDDEDDDGEYAVTVWFASKQLFDEAHALHFRGSLHAAARELFKEQHQDQWDLIGDCILNGNYMTDAEVVPDLYYSAPDKVTRTKPT